MSRKNYKIAGLATLALGCAVSAHAGFVTTSSVSPGAYTTGIVPSNEFRTLLAWQGVTTYTLGTSLGVDQLGSVEYFYYGKEAGYNNLFAAWDSTHFIDHWTGTNPNYQNYFNNPISIGTVYNVYGELNFGFCAKSGSTVVGCLTNDENDGEGWRSDRSIAYSVLGDTAWLFWDDSGAGPDDNHDDMLIKAVFTPKAVPEPASLGLFGLGLLGAWVVARRRKAA